MLHTLNFKYKIHFRKYMYLIKEYCAGIKDNDYYVTAFDHFQITSEREMIKKDQQGV